MSNEQFKPSAPVQPQSMSPALLLAIMGGFAIGLMILIKQLPTHHLSKSDIDRLHFYRYLREKGKLES